VAEKVAASKLLAKADLAPLAVAMPGVVRAPGAPPPQPVDPDAIKDLEEKRLEIRATEEARQRTVEGLKQRLADAELTLTPMHPTVMALKQQVEAMSGPPPELAALRSEERALMAQIASPKVDVAPPPIVWPLAPTFYRRDSDPAADAEAPSAQPFAAQAVPTTPLERDGQLQLAQSQLGLAIAGYEDALARLDATKVELDITGAAYKHRYTVITPAELPRSPKKATAQLVGAGSVFGGAALALLLTTGLDLAGGLVLESWQVRRRLKLEIVGELDNPS
jgi:hypothetical protein